MPNTRDNLRALQAYLAERFSAPNALQHSRADAALVPEPDQPTMRSANTPMGDRAAQITGQPVVGDYVSGIDRQMRGFVDHTADQTSHLANIAGEMTGVPTVARGAADIGAGAYEGSPLQVARGVGNTALGVIPGLSATRIGGKVANATFGTPLRATGTTTTAIAPGTIIESQKVMAQNAPDGLSRDALRSRLKSMSKDERKAYQRKLGFKGGDVDGVIGKNTLDRALPYEMQRAAEASVENKAKLDRERIAAQAEAEAKIATAKIEAEQKAAEKTAIAEKKLKKQEREDAKATPLRDLYPEVMPYLAAAPVVAGGALAGYLKSRGMKAFNDEIMDVSERWSKAVRAGNRPLAEKLGEQFEALRKKSDVKGEAGRLVAAGGLGAEISVLPEEIDMMRGVPGAWERATDLETVGKRALMGSILSALPGHAASKVVGARGQNYVKGYGAETATMKAKPAAGRSQAKGKSQLQTGTGPLPAGSGQAVAVPRQQLQPPQATGQLSTQRPTPQATASNTSLANSLSKSPSKSNPSGPLELPLGVKDKIKTLAFKQAEKKGSIYKVNASNLGYNSKAKGVTPEKIDAYLNKLKSMAKDTGHTDVKSQIRVLQKLREGGAKFAAPVAGGGAIAASQIDPVEAAVPDDFDEKLFQELIANPEATEENVKVFTAKVLGKLPKAVTDEELAEAMNTFKIWKQFQ